MNKKNNSIFLGIFLDLSNKKSIFLCFILVLLLCVCTSTQAQDNQAVEEEEDTTESSTVQPEDVFTSEDSARIANFQDTIPTIIDKNIALHYDSSSFNVRKISNEKLENYRKNSDFNYEYAEPTKETTIWQLFLDWLRDKLGNVGTPDKMTWEKVLFYAVVGILLVIAVLKLAQVDMSVLFYKGKSLQSTSFTEIEDITEANYDKLRADAIANQQYPLAVRYGYLKALQMLTNKEMIDFRPNKTNTDYFAELAPKKAIQKQFGEISLAFEYVYYGDFSLNKSRFEKINNDFDKFYTKI